MMIITDGKSVRRRNIMIDVPKSTYKLLIMCLIASLLLSVVVVLTSSYHSYDILIISMIFGLVVIADILFIKLFIIPKPTEEQ